MKDLASGHPLLDGAVFELTREDPKKEVSDEPLKLQWDLLRMTGFPGPAEAVNDPVHGGQMGTCRNSKKATMPVA
jgi:hypothetical protein